MSIVNYENRELFPTQECNFFVMLLNNCQSFRCYDFSTEEDLLLLNAFRLLYDESGGIMPAISRHRQANLAQQVGLMGATFMATYYERRFQVYQTELESFCEEIKHDLACPAYRKHSAYSKRERNRSIGAFEVLLDQCGYYLESLNQNEHELSEQKKEFMQRMTMVDIEKCKNFFTEGSTNFELVYNACVEAVSGMNLSEILTYYPQCIHFSDQITLEISYRNVHCMLMTDIYNKYRLIDYRKGR